MASNCQCMLCEPRLKMQMIDSDPPTILCLFIEYWKSLYQKCCCLLHPDCEFITQRGKCTCPRCCFCANLPRKDPLRCASCKSKVNCYHVCKHHRGDCGNYGRCNKWAEWQKIDNKTV